MKNLFTKAFALLSVVIVSACHEDGPDYLPVGDTLEGAWIMTEYGYSPGGDYITKKVPTDPAKTVTFRSNGTLTSNMEGFSEYGYYRILDLPHAPEVKIVALFKTEPQGSPDAATVSPAYLITFTEDLLKLGLRGCIEGCHIGLKRTVALDHGSGQ